MGFDEKNLHLLSWKDCFHFESVKYESVGLLVVVQSNNKSQKIRTFKERKLKFLLLPKKM
jgi:hypothetical protein